MIETYNITYSLNLRGREIPDCAIAVKAEFYHGSDEPDDPDDVEILEVHAAEDIFSDNNTVLLWKKGAEIEEGEYDYCDLQERMWEELGDL